MKQKNDNNNIKNKELKVNENYKQINNNNKIKDLNILEKNIIHNNNNHKEDEYKSSDAPKPENQTSLEFKFSNLMDEIKETNQILRETNQNMNKSNEIMKKIVEQNQIFIENLINEKKAKNNSVEKSQDIAGDNNNDKNGHN